MFSDCVDFGIICWQNNWIGQKYWEWFAVLCIIRFTSSNIPFVSMMHTMTRMISICCILFGLLHLSFSGENKNESMYKFQSLALMLWISLLPANWAQTTGQISQNVIWQLSYFFIMIFAFWTIEKHNLEMHHSLVWYLYQHYLFRLWYPQSQRRIIAIGREDMGWPLSSKAMYDRRKSYIMHTIILTSGSQNWIIIWIAA